MATTRLSDIIEPSEFTKYQIVRTMEQAPLVQAGVMRRNGVIDSQLQAGAHSFTIPAWNDLGNDDPDIVTDDPNVDSTPNDITSIAQVVRKAFLHNSWSAMNLASEISGDDAVGAIRSRVSAYWQRVLQSRLIDSLVGLYNVNNAAGGDMINDISGKSGNAANFSASAVIDTSATLGDALGTLTGIAMHSDIYTEALKQDLIDFIPDSQGGQIATYRGLAVVVDDKLPTSGGTYTTVLFGNGAFGYGIAAPRIASGTEIENKPSAGNGGGQEILHSRVNLAVHPAGYKWTETNVSSESPSGTELQDKDNWNREVSRKHVPIAFLKSKIG